MFYVRQATCVTTNANFEAGVDNLYVIPVQRAALEHCQEKHDLFW